MIRPDRKGFSRELRRGLLLAVLLLGFAAAAGQAQTVHPVVRAAADIPFPPIPALDPTFNLELVDLYAEFFPDLQEAEFIAVLFLETNGSDPVILRCDGNFKHLQVGGDQTNLSFVRQGPYFWLYNLNAGVHQVRFTYRARHDGFAPVGSTIAPHQLSMPASVFWYPRNTASDTHQLIVNAVMPEGYFITANASLTRDLPHNFRRLRTWIRAVPAAEGLSLVK